ncbi:hypothetical protein GQ457_14G023580 [Hibiscus cannabinus]
MHPGGGTARRRNARRKKWSDRGVNLFAFWFCFWIVCIKGLNISSAILVLYGTQKNFWATKGDPFTVQRFFHGLPF